MLGCSPTDLMTETLLEGEEHGHHHSLQGSLNLPVWRILTPLGLSLKQHWSQFPGASLQITPRPPSPPRMLPLYGSCCFLTPKFILLPYLIKSRLLITSIQLFLVLDQNNFCFSSFPFLLILFLLLVALGNYTPQCFLYLILTQDLTKLSGWPWTCNPCASAPQVGVTRIATMPGHHFFILTHPCNRSSKLCLEFIFYLGL